MSVDIRINIDLPGHPKYKRLRRIIQASPMEYLICFWGYVARYAPTGQLHGWCPSEIEDAAGWAGTPGVFCAALLEVGFLDEVEGGFEPHDWCDHQTWVVKAPERSASARKAINARWSKKNNDQHNQADTTESLRSEYGANTDSIRTPDTPSPSPSPLPSLKPKVKSSSACVREDEPLAGHDLQQRAGEREKTKGVGEEKARNLVVTDAESRLRAAVAEKRPWLEQQFPELDIGLETEELVAKYRGQSVGTDPALLVIRWCKQAALQPRGRDRPAAKQMVTFEQAKLHNTLQAMREFAEGG